MKRIAVSFSILSAVIPLLMTSASPSSTCASSDTGKMKPEELVVKHLQSLGPAEALATARSRVITGNADVTFRVGGRGHISGTARLVSQGDKSSISLTFGALDYPHEKLGFDGTRLTASQVKPGVRTIIGRYLLTNEALFREGLFGGALSTSWALLDLSRRNPKLQYQGLKKIDKRQAHQLKCSPRNTNVSVNLFFDPETFHHIATQYQQTVSPTVALNRPHEAPAQEETRVNILEEFSDFSQEGGLTLPHLYRLKLEVIGPSGSMLYEWSITLKQFKFGEPVSANDFNIVSV